MGSGGVRGVEEYMRKSPGEIVTMDSEDLKWNNESRELGISNLRR